MSKTRKWYAKGLYVVFALALLVGLSVTPVSAGAVSKPTVTVEPTLTAAIGKYTIDFNTSVTGALAVGQDITIDFDETGTGYSTIKDGAYSTGDVTVNGEQIAGNKIVGTAASQKIVITLATSIAASSSVEVIINKSLGITNPDAALYTLDVYTTGDGTPTGSKSYIISGYPGKGVSLYTSTGAFIDSYTTIAAAVGKADTNYTIKVDPGTYAPTATNWVGVAGLTIEGANAGVNPVTGTRGPESIIDSTADPIFSLEADDMTFDGFTLDQTGSSGTAIWVSQWARITVKNNIITGCGSSAITVLAESGPAPKRVVDNATISGNIIEDCSKGISVGSKAKNCTISNNTITGCTSTAEGAIGFWGAGANNDNTISGNILTDNLCVGIWFGQAAGTVSDGNVVKGNTISNNGKQGIYVASTVAPTNMIITGNDITDNTGVGIQIAAWDATNPGLIKFNNITGNDSTNGYGLKNTTSNPVDALHNWWGSTSSTAIAAMIKDTTTGVTSYEPWLGASVSAADYAAATTSLNRQSTVGAWVTSSDTAAVGVAKYTGNPQGTHPEFTALGYFDVYAYKSGAWTLVTIKLYDAAVTSDSEVWFWSATENDWIECYKDGAVSGDYAWVEVRAYNAAYLDRVPVLTDLVNLPFAIGTEEAVVVDVEYYDADNSGYIEIDELLNAISDYIGGVPGADISLLLEVISAYINETAV